MKIYCCFLQYFPLLLVFVCKTIDGSEWNIRCRFDGRNDNKFWIGETISGFVDFIQTDSSVIKLRSINAELIGELILDEDEGNRDSEGSKKSQKEIFFQQKILVHPLNKTGTFRVPYGTHSWPFHFQLAKDLPPSLHPNSTNILQLDTDMLQMNTGILQLDTDTLSFNYFVRFTFVRPEWYRFNVEKKFPIVVQQPTTFLPAIKLQMEKASRSGVRLRVTLNNSIVFAQNNLSFNIDLDNPKGAFIHHITVHFIQYIKTYSGKRANDIIKIELDGIRNRKDKHINENFQLNIPLIITSFCKNGTRIFYSLHVEVHLRGIFTNIRLEVPIILKRGELNLENINRNRSVYFNYCNSIDATPPPCIRMPEDMQQLPN
ncbi:unnamed protein product [Adineta ricciae]|uniref:Arrestin-like N-terminal domain-containing protein n=1 Tax=Adineta ricciae TaxID=249248 RepID=A0A815U6X9_ADIRI|nr:unnamed protein product [Adineta ricciae]CAF1510016.1 unnamed protein product [Adineta ricciae]